MKLVRDRIRLLPNRPGEAFGPQNFRLCHTDEYPSLLVDKLDEELQEMAKAQNNSHDFMMEVCDVIEVLLTMTKQYGFSRQYVLDAMEAKRFQKGGFDAGVVLIGD